MAWDDRLREARYEAPNGDNIVFLYEDVQLSFDKKTSAFNFPDAEGTYIQDLGNAGKKFPLRIFLSGEDYDLQANKFLDFLSQKGAGRLSHPIYGVYDVVPFGTITRLDNLKTQANQAIFEITFWETINLIYPSSQTDPSSDVLSVLNEFKDQASLQFANNINLDDVSYLIDFEINYKNSLNIVANGLKAVSNISDDIKTQFNIINQSINQSIDTLIVDPITLSFQTINLIEIPARVITDIKSKINIYYDLAFDIISKDNIDNKSSQNINEINDFYKNDLLVASLLSGVVLSAIENEFETRKDALDVAQNLLDKFESVKIWRENNFLQLQQIDTGELYQKLNSAISLCAGFLVKISFSLKQEHKIFLERDRTIIDLCAELYGDIDNSLNFLINSNNLTGSEILELKRGREIVYYI